MLLTGKGTAFNFSKAPESFRRPLEIDSSTLKLTLVLCLFNIVGVPQDLKKDSFGSKKRQTLD
jgi:hypothetical protein